MLTIALIIVTGWIVSCAIVATALCRAIALADTLADEPDHAAHDDAQGLEAINATDTHGIGG